MTKPMVSFALEQDALDLLNQFVELDEGSRSEFIRDAIWEKLLQEAKKSAADLDRINRKHALEAAKERGGQVTASDLEGWTIDPDDPEAVKAERTYRWTIQMLHYLEEAKSDHAAAIAEIDEALNQIQTEAAA